MPSISSKITLTSAAQSANTVVADIELIKGATYSVENTSSLDSINSNYLNDGQVIFVQSTATFYKLTITPANPPFSFVDTYDWDEVSLGSAGSYVEVSQTSSMSVLSAVSASYINPTFISASAAAAGFGSGGGGSTDLTALNSFTGSAQTSLDALNVFTGSTQTSLDALNAVTSSYLTSDVTSSFVLVSQTSSMNVLSALTASFISDTFISASVVRSGFGSTTLPSGVLSSSAQIATDISGAFTEVSGGFAGRITTLENANANLAALNLFTSSIQTQVDSLTAETSSYLTAADTASFVNVSQTSSMSVLNAVTASYINPTFISASAAAAGFGAGGSVPAGTISSSIQISALGYITSSDVDLTSLNTFTASAQTSLDSLNAATGSYLTAADTASFIVVSQTSSMSVATASYIDPTFISASAAASGFGSGGGSTDISALNLFTSSIQTQVDNLTAETSSYLTSADTASFIVVSQTSSMSVATASYIDPTFISASAAASGFGSGGQAANFTGSLQDVTDYGATTTNVISTPGLILTGSLDVGRGNGDKSSNIAIGNQTLTSNTTGLNNLAIGDGALKLNTSGRYNTAIGVNAMQTNETGRYNAAIGEGALFYNEDGYKNVAIGVNAGWLTAAGQPNLHPSSSIFIGFEAKSAYNANENMIVIGHEAIGRGDNTVVIGNSNTTDNYFFGNISGSDVTIDAWGSISASLAALSSGSITSAEVVQALVGQDLVVNSITAETYIVSSSITYMTTLFSSGSTMFGDSLGDTHQFTGSLFVLGNVTALSFTGSLFGTSSWAVNALTASYIDPTFISASVAAAGFGSGGGSTDISALNTFTGSAQTSLTALNAATASYITNSQTSSMSVASASYATYAVTASYTENLVVGGNITGSNWSISSDGVMTLGVSTPTSASAGSIYFDGTNFYFGI